MKTVSSLYKSVGLSAALCASLVASAAFALPTSGAALAPNTHVCVEIVDYRDAGSTPVHTGHSQLGTTTVSGGTIEAAASACHGATLAAFVANKAWSAPEQICADTHGRNFSRGPITIWALDQFQDMPGNWNRVEGYTVECGLKGNVPALAP